ncbi:MAG: pilus assembly protein [Actinomycetota bacterium]|jgi:Flp pilus assembly protein TadG|nr:pilus assembly protein [Actinomycetota bacterium]
MHRQRGSATVELLVLVPVVVVFASFVVALGRYEVVRAEVAGAARAGAEAAAEAPTPYAASAAARQAAPAAVDAAGGACRHLAVSTDVGAFDPGGSVTVTVRCTVPLADLAVPGLPGSASTTSTVRAPIDTYRNQP